MVCFQVEGMLFFTTNYGRNVSLAEFDSVQQHTTSMVSYVIKYLHNAHDPTNSDEEYIV